MTTKPDGMTETEFCFRTAFLKLRAEGRNVDDFLNRPLAITVYPGHYGPAGAILAINGSPTRGIVAVVGHWQNCAAVYWLDNAGHAKVISRGLDLHASGARADLAIATWALLQERGLIDERGNLASIAEAAT